MTGKKDRLTVRLNGGGPWGFRLQGGYPSGLPLTVYKVRRKSKAYRNLREGDVIATVNGHPCENLSYEKVMEIADKSGPELCLEVLREVSNKENVDPGIKTTKQLFSEKISGTNAVSLGEGGFHMEDTVLKKEEITLTESTTTVTEQTEGMRIKSVSVQPEPSPNFPSQVHTSTSETKPQGTTAEVHDTFPLSNVTSPPKSDHSLFDTGITSVSEKTGSPFGASIKSLSKEVSSPFDTSTKSVSEEESSDDRKFEKTTTERVHEKHGNTETTFMKEEHEFIIRDGPGKFNDLESSLTNGSLNFDTSTINTKFDINGPTSLEESQTFTSVKSSSVKETSSSYQTDAQNSMSDIISSLGLKAPFSEDFKDSSFSSSVASTTTTSETSSQVQKHPSSPPPPPPKPKLRPFSDPCVEGLLDRQDDSLRDMPRTFMDTDSIDLKSTEEMFTYPGSALVTKKKKMFSSSSFYEEPHAIYPTVEEQVEMAKKIADSLADDTNKKSKGANMFFKRVKRSSKWVHEGPEPSDESEPTTPEVQGVEPPTPDPSKVPWKSKQNGMMKLKLVLDPRHPEDAMTLKSSGHNISEHNVVSPDICHDLVRDLESPVGKGAALFAKRKKKSSEWVVDEEKVKNLMKTQESVPQLSPAVPSVNRMMMNPRVKLLKSPWEAALESPIGSCDAAFYEVNRVALADSVIRAAESKMQDPLPEYSSLEMETCPSPPVPVTPAAAYYEIYKPKAPKGWDGVSSNSGSGSNFSLPTQPTYVTNEIAIEKPVQKTSSLPRKMVFHNFNTKPRVWKSPAN